MNPYYIVDLLVALGLDPLATVEDICIAPGLYVTVGALIQVLGTEQSAEAIVEVLACLGTDLSVPHVIPILNL